MNNQFGMKHCEAKCNRVASNRHHVYGWLCAEHFREILKQQEHAVQEFTPEVADVDFSQEPLPLCEGYKGKQGRCPHYATENALWEDSGDQKLYRLCALCFEEFESDRRQAEWDESDDSE